MAEVTIRQALQAVADNPRMLDDELIQVPIHELVSRNLFEIANHPDSNVRGANARANKARKLILERLVGKRRPGTGPAAKQEEQIEFVDLTSGVLS